MWQRELGLGLCVALAAACGGKGEGPSDDGQSPLGTDASSVPAGSAASSAAPSPSAVASGELRFKHSVPKTPALAQFAPLFEHGRLPSVVEVLNGRIQLPRDVLVLAGACGKVNAYYSADKHFVGICYELADFVYRAFRDMGQTDEQASNSTLNALTFVTLHEIGHAVIGELELGVTGGEEDAVDDFAALLLVDLGQPGMAADGAQAMAALGKLGKGRPAYFDEHSLGEQRFYNIVCTVYGSNPDKYRAVVERKVLPESRAVKCAKEFERKEKAWALMLGPHTKRQ